ncbi:FAD:protein FMN transferase [Roseivivax sp. THAF30]|uniref:FAD:protein FMN transferase n=1 Tax=Roseivivax sp. THAF30 TaxID=2587852 RepID=UPI0012685F80|nr:FAD:protein FMN transferase [Roseivivax sp. THAF30]QFT64750.1 Thiamine biosynthesis lipoprotein ApbE precursor [Roseivivax sp. THAF30]
MKRRRFLTLAAAFACAPSFAVAQTWRGRALGAEVSVALSGPRPDVDAALAAIPGWLEEVEAEFSLYRPDSALSRLNAAGHLDPSSAFAALMTEADAAHRLSGGLFDPTVQPLWRALAAGHDAESARSLIGWDKVRRAGAIRLGPGQALTFNGIAQGFATDLVTDRLAARGFTHALIDIGETRALGGPFRLGLEDPVQGFLGQRTLTGGAIATSSPGAMALGGGAHILGPRKERPVWSTVSIEADRAVRADALSTAAVFMDQHALGRLKTEAGLSRITCVAEDGRLLTL